MRKALLLASCVVALAACGDNNGGSSIDASSPDAEAPPDAISCPARPVGEVGGGCETNVDCESAPGAGDGVCYVGPIGPSVFAPEGYCTVDNGAGTVCAVDGDCGAGNLCVDVGGYKLCLPACDCPGDGCPANQACLDVFNSFPLDKAACVPGNDDALDGDACAGLYECAGNSGCLNDALEFPGGQCARVDCTVGDDTTCLTGHCVDVTGETPLNGTLCVDTCTDDSDCRETEGYTCFAPGGAEPSYCRHPHVGDSCTTADDCGGGTWICETSAGFLGGYCTQTACPNPGTSSGECSPGSVCTDPLVGPNYCADRCADADIGTQGRCRTGYTCVDADPLPDGPGNDHTTGGCVPPASI